MNQWTIKYDKDCKGVRNIYGTMQQYVNYPIVCGSTDAEKNVVSIKLDNSIQGYRIIAENECIEIIAQNETNLLYAASDFKNKYMPYWKNPGNKASHYFKPFIDQLIDFKLETKPRIKRRGIWTWGHVIYDYKKYIDNMVTLRLNTLIIWNDFVPLNINEVIDYAHQNGIEIYLGFAWGWDQKCAEQIKDLDTIPGTIAKKYEDEYSKIHCDGIYFQTFTELTVEEINGVTIADAAVELVNKTTSLILDKNPDLEILFGLHATSVKTKLDVIATVDPRVTVMWEDLGNFPYGYIPSVTEGFEDTLRLQQNIRVKFKNFAAVLKGVACLDWVTFEHQSGPFVMGEQGLEKAAEKLESRRDLLRHIQAFWIKNAKYAHEIIKDFSENDIITVLCEDCGFEKSINFPMAVYANMLWDSNRPTEDILCESALMSEVDFI